MPLRDHFHAPWQDHHHWEGFHSAWANTLVRHLNLHILPQRYRAIPQVHLGAWVEADVAAFEETPSERNLASVPSGGTETSLTAWSPPAPVETLTIEFPAQGVCEVQVLDLNRDQRLVGVVEFVSPGKKDREDSRRAFAAKCAGYLYELVGVVTVDIVTSRRANLHDDLRQMLGQPSRNDFSTGLYAVAYRARPTNGQWQLDTWPERLEIGRPLPALPLWLASDVAVSLPLEATYQETCAVLRIA